jgi:hypothetical protein
MAQYPKILGLLGLGSEKEALTEAHMQAAEDKITQLEQGKTDAEQRSQTLQASLTTATEELTTTKASLETEKGKVATLQQWKDNQAQVDGREEDESNTLDDNQTEALAPWEKLSASAIASAKKRVGEK